MTNISNGCIFVLLCVWLIATSKPRAAVCFFGLPRSLNVTLTSISSRLIKPLSCQYDVDIFIHTFNKTTITNPRSNEHNAVIRPLDVMQLNATKVIIEEERNVLGTMPFEHCKRNGDPWNDQHQSLKNYMFQLYSLSRVTRLLTDTHVNYDLVVFARPDVYYFTPIDVEQTLHIKSTTLYAPSFHDWGGLNDRFGFGDYATMVAYGTRHRLLQSYCEIGRSAHAERFLLWYINQNNISVQRTPMLFGRVRANGVIWEIPDWQLNRTKPGLGFSIV